MKKRRSEGILFMLLAAVLTAGCGRGQVMGDKEGEVS